jgi:hypothetical protein
MSPRSDDPFETALAALLAPLAQAMVARGLTIGTATEALKQALVNAAIDAGGDTISDSKASLLTGIHRKDIKRLRHEDGTLPQRRSCNAAALAISHWATAPDYQGPDGQPRDLPRQGDDTVPGFDTLIRRARIDMAPGTVLEALQDQGAVAAQPDGRFRLLTHALLPSGGSAEQVAAYQATLSAHLAAATHNLLAGPDTPRHFDRAVRYSHLSEASIAVLTQLAADKAQTALKEINAQARSLQERDQDGGVSGRFAFGAYILPSPEEGDT